MTILDDDVAILSQEGERIARCEGPRPDGRCPRIAAGDLIPCAGAVIVPAHAAGPLAYLLHVPADARRCPLEWAVMDVPSPDAFRRHRQPNRRPLSRA